MSCLWASNSLYWLRPDPVDRLTIQVALSLFLSFSGFESIPMRAGRPCDREAIRNGLWLKKRAEDEAEDEAEDGYEWSVPTQVCSFQSFHSGNLLFSSWVTTYRSNNMFRLFGLR